MRIEIFTDRFFLRELLNKDVTERYLQWLQNADAKKYITYAEQAEGLEGLKRYVSERINREDVLFLAIFDKSTGLHIGNIKYEPVNSTLGFAVMGILIGDIAFRGKGVGTEVLNSSARWLKKYRNINKILLGVSKDNIAAIKSYEKVGFIASDSLYLQKTADDQIIMSWNIPD